MSDFSRFAMAYRTASHKNGLTYNEVLYQSETKTNGTNGQIKSKPYTICRILVDEKGNRCKIWIIQNLCKLAQTMQIPPNSITAK
jgi:hypothetical protein